MTKIVKIYPEEDITLDRILSILKNKPKRNRTVIKKTRQEKQKEIPVKDRPKALP